MVASPLLFRDRVLIHINPSSAKHIWQRFVHSHLPATTGDSMIDIFRIRFCLSVLFLIGAVSCAGLDSLTGQQVGDRVVIMANFDTKIRSQKVGKVYGGSINTLTNIEDKWCMVEGTQGWLPLQYTMALDSAAKVYKKRVAANPKDVDAVSVLGMIDYEKGNNSQALQQLTKALNMNNRVATIWNNRAIVLSAANRLDDALRDINIALDLNKNYAGAYGNRGLILVGMGRFDEAIADFSKAIELDSDNPTHYKNRGAAYQNIRKRDEALADFNRAIQIDRLFAKAYIGRANVYLSRGDLNNAFLNAKEAVRLNSKSPLALNNLGWVLYRRGNLDDAIAYFTRAINLDSQMSIAFSNRGVVYTDQSKLNEAISDFNRALSIEPGSAIGYHNRANAYLGKGEYRRAQSDFEQAEKLASDLPDVLNGYSWFLATCPDRSFRNGEKASEMIDKAVGLESEENWNLLDTQAAVLAELGEFERAVEIQEKAIEIAPESNKKEFQERLQLYIDAKPFRAKTGKNQRNRN